MILGNDITTFRDLALKPQKHNPAQNDPQKNQLHDLSENLHRIVPFPTLHGCGLSQGASSLPRLRGTGQDRALRPRLRCGGWESFRCRFSFRDRLASLSVSGGNGVGDECSDLSDGGCVGGALSSCMWAWPPSPTSLLSSCQLPHAPKIESKHPPSRRS